MRATSLSLSLPIARSQSGLVLAAMRQVMALLFGLWVWIDPHHPFRANPATWAIYVGYLLFAGTMLAVAYRSWWFEYRLARIAFVIDAATFLIGVYLTEAVTLDFFSPFLAFFAFLMLTSATRWKPRTILIIAAVLALCFLLVGALGSWEGLHVDMPKFVRRFSNLIVLSLMLSWFAFNRNTHLVPRLDRQAADDRASPLQCVLDYAVAAYGAANGAIAWLNEGETRCDLQVARAPRPTLPPLSPDALPARGAGPVLFDRAHRRALSLDDGHRLSARVATDVGGLPAALDIDEGLSIPIVSRTGRGQLVLYGIRGLCSDDLFSAQGIAREIAAAIDDEETEALQREVAMSRLRSQIATDLHDSVIQTLAGTRFRIEALRRGIGDSADVAAEIDTIGAGLSAEQDHVRTIIDQLRRGEVQPGRRDLHREIGEVAGRLADQWLIAVEVDMGGTPLTLPTAIIFDVQQIVREGVANAVRHGQARTVRIAATLPSPTRLALSIEDDGTGFGDTAGEPRSIAERIEALGGTLALRSGAEGSRLDIELPMAGAA